MDPPYLKIACKMFVKLRPGRLEVDPSRSFVDVGR